MKNQACYATGGTEEASEFTYSSDCNQATDDLDN